MGQLVLDRPILLTIARHAFTSFRADLRSGTLHAAFDVHVARFPVYCPYGLPSYLFAFRRQLEEKRKKKKKNTPVSTLPVFFNFFPFSSFLGGNLEIWKNLHTKILASVVSIVIGLTVDRIKRIVNFGIKIHYGVYYGEK